jgi:hypothetical protein
MPQVIKVFGVAFFKKRLLTQTKKAPENPGLFV